MARMTNTSFMTGIKNWVLGKIANIMALIPNQASSSNQLADKNFVNSSIATATATFRGTYNVVSDLSLSYNATHAQIEAALVMKMAALSIVVDNNDYAFVQIPTADATPTEIAKIEKYKYNGTAWAFEYELNNSGFTAAQWAAINSGATLELIGKLSALPTNSELTTILNGKASKAENSTAGHFASLDANGNPTDSGISLEDNGAYDVTAHNSGAKFADLSALLSNVNLNTLIPVAVRKGGMSIKFVQSSDNKYVQCRLMAEEFTTDTTQWATADEGVYVENPEFVYVKTDKEGKILLAIKTDGGIYYGAGVPQQVIDYITEKISELSLDEYEDIVAFLNGLEEEGQTLQQLLSGKVDKIEGKGLSTNDYTDEEKELVAVNEIVDNPEYIKAEVDAEGKLLAGRTPDGAAFENVGLFTPKVSIDGHTIDNYEDPEGRYEITTDAENRIISYIDNNGVKHESVGIETDCATINHLNLTESGMTEFQQALNNSGFKPGGKGDWSEYLSNDGDNPLCIPIPRSITLVNILSNVELRYLTKSTTTGAVEGVTYDVPCQVEFYDMDGNYFKKWVLMSGQGNSSMAYPKKNIALDFFDSEVDGDAFKVKFGNWVPQDGWHLKAYYTDPFRCIGLATYKLYDEIVKTRGIMEDYVYKKALIDFSKIGYVANGYNDLKDISLQYETGAKCFPDGFPCIVYQNGEFWGMYCWQIKKHRDNYHMKKSNGKHIHLDGTIDISTLFNGTINWNAFEIRNPKDLYLMDGTKYNADTNLGELIDNTSQYYDANNSKHVTTAEVKQRIINLSNVMSVLSTAEATYNASSKTAEDLATLKSVFETYFDVDNLVDYIILCDITRNYDGFSKNWQWLTYNGVKWWVGLYDCDGCFGGNFTGTSNMLPLSGNHIYTSLMYRYIITYYNSELEARYAELRHNNIIDKDNIIKIINSIMLCFGEQNVEKEFNKWINCPCNRDVVLNENWEFDLDENGNPQLGIANYNNSTTYNVGDSCFYAQYPGNGEATYKYKAKASVTGVKPVDSFGYRDSIYRLYNWIKKSIENMDIVYSYNN